MNQEASESTWMLDFLAWLEVNKKPLLVGTLVAVALAAAVSLYRWRTGEREFAASEALAQLQLKAGAGAQAKPPQPAEFLKLADDFSGTRAAGRALLLAGRAAFVEGKYPEAMAAFERAGSAVDNEDLQAMAAYGKAACQEGLGKPDAAAAYQDVVNRFPTTSAGLQARFSLGGLYESRGDKTQAARYYSEVTNIQSSAWAGEAIARLMEIRKTLPASNAPAAPLSTPGLAPAPAPAPGSLPGLSTNR